MAITPTFPGVYIEEVPSGVRTITPVATAITAFIGSAPRGPANDPIRVQSFADYQRKFGGLKADSAMSYAVSQYFPNGGSDALIVRVTSASAAKAVLSPGGLPLEVASAGKWGDSVRAHIDLNTREGDTDTTLFNLFVFDEVSKELEEFRNVSTLNDSPRFIRTVLEEASALVRIPAGVSPSGKPGASGPIPPGTNWFDNGGPFTQAAGGSDGGPITEPDIIGSERDKTGLFALDKADLFNMLCIPPIDRVGDTSDAVWKDAIAYCIRRRAMLLIDAPSGWKTVDQAENLVGGLRQNLGGESLAKNAALFFPRVRMSDPLKQNRLAEFVPSGAIAGIFARTDVARGVWKAPAGIDAGFNGVREFTVKMTDGENGRLNPLAVNCLRNFRAFGNVVWGSRTMAGTDALGSDHKYIPVRRFTLFLEESLYRGTQWVVFEPNDEPLWNLIRLNIGAFMNTLFRQGAFQGRTTSQAYFVKCDAETTTQNDINRGIVNIEVGFAPLKPAEFVIIKIQQIAGRIQT